MIQWHRSPACDRRLGAPSSRPLLAGTPASANVCYNDAMAKMRLAFICLGNSCRSIMAEALARHCYGSLVDPASAGLSPLGWVAPETLEVLAEIGARIAGLHSKGLAALDLPSFPVLVLLTRHPLPPLTPPYEGRVRQRPVTDPFGRSLAVYRQTREEIVQLLDRELQEWLTA
jgi:protein-tyrosine-phosphatase